MGKISIEYSEHEGYSLRSRAFNQLRENILNGVLKPGDSLVETKLSEEMGVSRTPIREAIRQLELEGLVQTTPNKGTVVTGISAQDIEDIYTIRMMIEGLAARWAAEKVTADEIKEMQEAIELEEFYTEKNDNEHLLLMDSRFHSTIFKACKSKTLMQTLSTFHHYVQKARISSFATPGRARKALAEHKAIMQAIMAGDTEKAEKLTIEHVRNASINLISQREKKEEER